jgi:hypothetical protein
MRFCAEDFVDEGEFVENRSLFVPSGSAQLSCWAGLALANEPAFKGRA